MRTRRSERGMAAFWFVFVMGIALPAMVTLVMNYTSIVSKVQRLTQSVTSKQSIYVVKNMLLKDAGDVDSDGRFELLKEEAGNTIPVAVPGKSTDEWGTAFYYCTWDLGTLNGSDASYADNNVAPPVANLAGRIISAGKDKTVDTTCSDTTAQGDDLISEIFESDALVSNSAISGWTDDGSGVRLINDTDFVSIGDDLEIGTDGVNAVIDMHSAALASDYDVRFEASGGDGTAGNGALDITAAGGVYVNGFLVGTVGGEALVDSWTASGLFATRQAITQFSGLTLASGGQYRLKINGKIVNSSDVGTDASGVLTFNGDTTDANYVQSIHYYGASHNMVNTATRTFPGSAVGSGGLIFDCLIERNAATGYIHTNCQWTAINAAGSYGGEDYVIHKVDADLSTIDLDLGSYGFATGSVVELWKVR